MNLQFLILGLNFLISIFVFLMDFVQISFNWVYSCEIDFEYMFNNLSLALSNFCRIYLNLFDLFGIFD